jgi:plasmid maintenance system antidote protein VapI
MYRDIKLAILKKYDSQADFAPAIGLPESIVSRVLHGRRKLSKQEAAEWARVLECDPSVFEGVTAND